jgi:arginyl-tRNA synthetase
MAESGSPYEAYCAAIEAQIQTSQQIATRARKETPGTANTAASWQRAIDENLADLLATKNPSQELVHPPKNAPLKWQPDYALPMFTFAKKLRQNPAELAQNAAKKLAKSPAFGKIDASGPYLNLQLADAPLITNLAEILNSGEHFGKNSGHSGEVAIVEYSSPNVAKPFGINHLRSTVIGEALARLMAASGYAVVRDNHLGDWGTQFGNLLAAYQEYAPDKAFAELTMDELTALYVRFSDEKKTSPALKRKGQQAFAALEAGDQDLLAKWVAAMDKSLADFRAMYERLHVRFDTMIGEAYFVADADKLVTELANLAPKDLVVFDKDSKAVYINGEHPVVIRSQDGYGVYASRDLATVQFRRDSYNPDLVLYVVGQEQASYFRSVFDVAAQAGLAKKPDGTKIQLEHISFGLLLDKSGKKLSTRKGTSGKLEDVIAALDAQAVQETKSRNPDMDAKKAQEIATNVAVGALIWNDLKTDLASSVRFDIDSMLKLGGGSVIDILYTYSRTCSILRKLDIDNSSPLENDLPGSFSTPTEHRLAAALSEFPQIVQKAANARAPHHLILYLQDLAALHGRFYEESRVTGLEDEKLKNLRINLHRAYQTTVQNALNLLNIPLSEQL